MSPQRVLIIDDEANMRHMLQTILGREGYDITTAADGREGLEKLQSERHDIVLCDLRMPEMDGLAFLDALGEAGRSMTIIMMSAYGTVDIAIEAVKRGAYDYIAKPFKADEIILTLRKAEERERLREENSRLRNEVQRTFGLEQIVTKSEKMLAIFETIRKIADYDTSVLITGESGTGKEMIARAVHYSSRRSSGPFIAVNCGAIPENLLESELFGYSKGAFTDACRHKKGLFEEAQGGTMLLDEIGELPLPLQVKLLRVLQEGEVRRIGDARQIRIDARILAATSRDLVREVRKSAFREDLFYRLNVIRIDLPPLRERREDIELLVNHFISRYNKKHRLTVEGLSPAVLGMLLEYDWPGNVRELENALERCIVLSETGRIEKDVLPPELRGVAGGQDAEEAGREYSLKKMSRIMEEQLIRKALGKTGGNRTHAARLLEISHPALLSKMKGFGIQ
jgi:two-component system response regulator AtoC